MDRLRRPGAQKEVDARPLARPLGDKVLLTAAFVVLTIPALAQPTTLPLWLTALCIGRDAFLPSPHRPFSAGLRPSLRFPFC